MDHSAPRRASLDHGGNLQVALCLYGGTAGDWVDLSTGIAPYAYPIGRIPPESWERLPDVAEQNRLINAARRFWAVPESVSIVAAPGASALIARIPALRPEGRFYVPTPTYNEHAAAFGKAGWSAVEGGPCDAMVAVHPNNPDGRWWQSEALTGDLRIIDESFCDIAPERSLMNQTLRGDTIVLKSFGKFWGLAGLRLGFAMGAPDLIEALSDMLGPWAVAGPALSIGAEALEDTAWATKHRARLRADAERLDRTLAGKGFSLVGGTDLFRLYETPDASEWQAKLAEQKVWSRIFPYSKTWVRLGIPPEHGWERLEALG